MGSIFVLEEPSPVFCGIMHFTSLGFFYPQMTRITAA
jgi:hypothetical protein